jgi:hypothetical protein
LKRDVLPVQLPTLPETTTPDVAQPAVFTAVDSDSDGLVDQAEPLIGSNPNDADTDKDGISDGYERFSTGTDPTLADTDKDRVADSAELIRGTDPLAADSDRDGRVDGTDASPDTDKDGLSDLLESILGTRVDSIDSDGDGATDRLEHVSGLDPTDPLDGALTSSSTPVGAGTVPGGSALSPDLDLDLDDIGSS